MALFAPLAWIALGITVPLSGTVEDANGRPVAGATVWLGDTIATHTRPEAIALAETDEAGRFHLDRPADLAGRGSMWSPTLWAFKPGSRIAFIEYKHEIPGPDEPARLVLGPPTETSIRVVDHEGKAVKDARLRPVQFTFKAPRPPDIMLDRLAVTTDADGLATLDGLSLADVFAADVTASDVFVQCLPVDSETKTITIRGRGRLKVHVVADDPRAARGWKITARCRPTEPDYRGPYTVHWFRKTTDDDGRVEYPAIAEGQILWEIKAPDGSPYLVDTLPSVRILPGKVAEVEIGIRRGVQVEGIVRDEPGGATIADLKVDITPLKTGRVNAQNLVTDAQGHFSTYVLPGPIRFSFAPFSMPDAYFLPPRVQSWLDFEVKEGEARHELTPPPLRKATQVRGRVVDEAGKARAGVTVRGRWTSAEFGENPNTLSVTTDAQGEFLMGGIAPKASVSLKATMGLIARSEPVTIASAGEGEPVVLHLKVSPTLALAGRVLGPDGQPISGALIQVRIRALDQQGHSGVEFAFDGSEPLRTGPDGRYRTPDQLPIGNQYQVEAEAPGFDSMSSGWSPPDTLNVADLTLRRAIKNRAILGRITDAEGQPISGAEVFQAGEGPKRARSFTDRDGRYQVSGVADTPSLLFVSKEGFHFVGRRVDPGDRPIDASLRRLDDAPASPLQPAASPVSRDEERAIARDLIAEVRKVPASIDDFPDRRRLPEINALVEPDRAIEMIEDQVVAVDLEQLKALALGRFEADPRKALEILDEIGQPSLAASTSLALFDRLKATAPLEFRHDLLERAEHRVREIEDSGQLTSLLSRLADRWLDLGDIDRGTKFVREAQVLEKQPRTQPFPDPRDDLILALARVDLPETLRLLQDRNQPASRTDRLRHGIAERIAPSDPDAARQLVEAMEPSQRSTCDVPSVCEWPRRILPRPGNSPPRIRHRWSRHFCPRSRPELSRRLTATRLGPCSANRSDNS